MKRLIFISLILFCGKSLSAQSGRIEGYISCSDSVVCKDAILLLDQTKHHAEVNSAGYFRIDNVSYGEYHLIAFAFGYQNHIERIKLDSAVLKIHIRLKPLESHLDPVLVQANRLHSLEITRMPGIEGTGIYEAKKTEVVQISALQANLSTNNPRQVFAGVTGLHIWESDAAGLQLGVGGRGLSPNRTSGFNTRQNGYDISADALGYPEAYYSPPMEALERIEVVRGAASLQYGTQFGGLLNFVTKKGPADKRIVFNSRQTLGSFGYYGSFNDLGGTLAKGKINYYTYYQYKKGDSWRENSRFESHTGGVRLGYRQNKKLEHQVEYTGMSYLAQQAGGLTDAAFEENPRQSFRSRNWFRVNWNLFAWQINFTPDTMNLLEIRNFGLLAERSSLGNLERINRLDPGGNRNLINGNFANIGQELRWRRYFRLFGLKHSSVLGYRLYYGTSTAQQGEGNAGTGPDFYFLNPDKLENSDYNFKNINIALFWESLFRLSSRWTITPGIRGEYINTSAEGYYSQRVLDQAGNVVTDRRVQDQRGRERSFLIAGLGTEYHIGATQSLYANFSQNYRAINFTDLRISNPSLQVDSSLRDERGYTADLGFRGEKRGVFIYEFTLFYLSCQGRIGQVLKTGEAPLYLDYRFRTNVSDARNMGVEAMAEINFFRLFEHKNLSKQDLNLFVNGSFIDARYIRSGESAVEGNKVEMVPPIMLRTGLKYSWKNFRLSVQFSYTMKHYSDATNSEWTGSAVEGVIPSYYVADVSAGWKKGRYSLEGSLNNALNAKYFTRRADSYPGPGIIPADARAFYLTFGIRLGK